MRTSLSSLPVLFLFPSHPCTATPHLHVTPYVSALLGHLSAGLITLNYLGCKLCLTGRLGAFHLWTDRKCGHSGMKFWIMLWILIWSVQLLCSLWRLWQCAISLFLPTSPSLTDHALQFHQQVEKAGVADGHVRLCVSQSDQLHYQIVHPDTCSKDRADKRARFIQQVQRQ